MTAKEKAIELYQKYAVLWHASPNDVKECALICIDEILSSNKSKMYPDDSHPMAAYWNQAKEEIKLL